LSELGKLSELRKLSEVKEIVRVILYMLDLSCRSQSYPGLSHVQSKCYRFHKFRIDNILLC